MMIRKFILIFVCFIFFYSSVQAVLVVNEAMVNEPGSTTSLEWFELYNDSPNDILSMSLYTVTTRVNNITFSVFPLAAYDYLVICRDTAMFKSFWGDLVPPDINLYEASFSFSNSQPGDILLYRAGVLHSELAWIDSGEDGVSWERISGLSGEIGQSVDRLYCTPGFLNSLTLVPNDLALENVFVRSHNDTTWLTYMIVNRGENLIEDGVLTLFYYDENDPQNETDVIASIDIPPVQVGFTTVINEPYVLPGRYVYLGATLNDDDRDRNNRRDFYAPGEDYPPFRLSEFLANPAAETSLTAEWIELKNISGENVPLEGWLIGDEAGLYDIVDVATTINPDEYFVLTEDSLDFLNYYPDYTGRLLQPDQWPRLNNDDDVVRLVDSFLIVADTFPYQKTYKDNYTWSRSELPGKEYYWGRSEKQGGTPGEYNIVMFEPGGGGLTLNIEPQIFSPDGDGYEDRAVITFDGPTGADYSLKLYDRQGRLLKTFFEDESVFDEEYTWDGRAGGRRLPIGIYIVYLESTGAGEIKKTVVLAR